MDAPQVQAANEAKSQFLATMSHEMRTPLNVIMGMNQLVMDTSLTEEQRKFTHQIKASSESLLLLINDILDLTKVPATMRARTSSCGARACVRVGVSCARVCVTCSACHRGWAPLFHSGGVDLGPSARVSMCA